MSIRIRLTRLGARKDAHGIEPSCGVMDIRWGSRTVRIVIDCGLIPDRGSEPFSPPKWHLPDLSFFDDGQKIDAVCLTHVHADHSGALPLLMPYLAPRALVWMTTPSAATLHALYEDDRRYAARGEFNGSYPIGASMDIEARIQIIRRPGEYEILQGVPMLVHPEGHINGACSFSFRLGGKNVHFSGDRCSHDQHGIRGAQPLPEKWRPHVIANSDCTYGADLDSDNRSWQTELDRGVDQVAATLRAGAPVMMCAFGVHRGGAIAHELSRRGLPDIAPVYLDGSCRANTEIAMSERGRWSDSDTLLHMGGVRWIDSESFRRSDVIARPDPNPYAVITTPGMGGPGGAASFWKRHILPHPEALLVFTGYQAPGTDGARIMAAVAERERTGIIPTLAFEDRDRRGPVIRELEIRCRVSQIRIGSHDSHGKILRWFEECAPETAVLCHGSSAALASHEAGLAGSIAQLVRSDLQGSCDIEV